MTPVIRLIAVCVIAALATACATTERLSAAGDVHTLLIAIRDNDHAAFNAHVDRRALEAQIQARMVQETRDLNLNESAQGVGLLLSGPLAHAATGLLVQPEVFRAVADYYGYKPDRPIPSSLELATILRPVANDRVCAARSHKGPCLLTFADEAGTWRLVSFDGEAAMLRLR